MTRRSKLNPKVALPSDAIAVVHRSDGSGTTFNFTNYLSEASAEWKGKAGSDTAVEWPTGLGAKGNEGVAGNVTQTKAPSAMSNTPMPSRTTSPSPRW